MSARRNDQGGFTFLELLIASTIFIAVIALSYGVFMAVSQGSMSQREESIGRQEVNNALDLLVKEITLVGYNRNKDDIDTAEPHRFVFWSDLDNNSTISLDNNPANDQPRVEKITVAWDSGTRRLTRTQDQGATLVVVDDVVDCLFEYFDAEGIAIDEDADPDNGQQITLQKNRDRIRRVRLTLLTEPYGVGRTMRVTRDMSLPNMAAETLEECGRIAMDAYMTIRACDPPGERGMVTVTTYDKNGDRTDDNDVLLSVSPAGSAFQWEDGTAVTDNKLVGDTRMSRETVYFVPDDTEAGKEYTVSAEWTPPETGCWKRVANAVMKVVAGDPCTIDFVEAPEEMIVCQEDDFDPGVNVVVAAQDTCGNFVPNVVVQVEIVGNDAQGSLGTIEGSPARPEIRSDQYGKAYFKYRPPESAWPETITLRATIVGDVGQDLSCNPVVTHVFPLLPNDASEVVKVSPNEPFHVCPDKTVDLAVRLRDRCGNDVKNQTNFFAHVAIPGSDEYLTDLQDQQQGGMAQLHEVDPNGNATPGVYWFRLHTGQGGFTQTTVSFAHPQLPGGAALVSYASDNICTCNFQVLTVPETVYGSGIPYNGAQNDLAKLRYTGDVGLSLTVTYTVTGGNLYLDPAGLIPVLPGVPVPLELGAGDVYVGNNPSARTPIGGTITVTAQDHVLGGGNGQCLRSAQVPVVCSASTLTVKDETGQIVDSTNPWDPTLSSAKLVATVVDKNLPAEAGSTITVAAVTDTGDNETITLNNGSGGYTFTNSPGMGFDDLKRATSPTDNDGELEPDLIGTVWVTYTDTTPACSAYNDVHTVQAPVDGCVDFFKMDFSDSPSDSGTWTTSYRTFSGHPEWSYNDWERGTPSVVGPTACPDGKCYGTDLDNNYGLNGAKKTYQAYLTRETPFRLATGDKQAFLVFDMWLNMGSGSPTAVGACAWVESKKNYAYDNTRYRTITVSSYNDITDKNYGTYNSCWGGNFTGGGWQHMVVDLYQLVANNKDADSRIRFSFYTNDADYLQRPGLYIDNVRVCRSTRGD